MLCKGHTWGSFFFKHHIKSRNPNEFLCKLWLLKKEDVADWCRWREGVGRVAKVIRCIRPSLFTREIQPN